MLPVFRGPSPEPCDADSSLFPRRFPTQLPRAAHQIRGCLQRHVQPGGRPAAAQQRLLVQGGVHAPERGPLGTAPQLRPGPGSAPPARQAHRLAVILLRRPQQQLQPSLFLFKFFI